MGSVIGEILPSAIGVAISPLPIAAVILMLLTPSATANGLAFLAGWVVGLAAVGAIVLAIAGPADLGQSGGQEPRVTGVVKLVIGVLLVALAARTWRKRPRSGETPALPKWLAAVDRFDAVRAGLLALALSAVNPKNLALTLTAALTIAGGGLSDGEAAGALAIFVLLGATTVATPVAAYLIAGRRASGALGSAKEWLVENNATVMTVLLLLIGVKLVGDGIGVIAG